MLLGMEEEAVVSGPLAPRPSDKKTRRSYTKDEKLKVLAFYKEHKNLYRTCKHFDISTKNVLRWAKDEDKIKNSKRGSRYLA